LRVRFSAYPAHAVRWADNPDSRTGAANSAGQVKAPVLATLRIWAGAWRDSGLGAREPLCRLPSFRGIGARAARDRAAGDSAPVPLAVCDHAVSSASAIPRAALRGERTRSSHGSKTPGAMSSASRRASASNRSLAAANSAQGSTAAGLRRFTLRPPECDISLMAITETCASRSTKTIDGDRGNGFWLLRLAELGVRVFGGPSRPRPSGADVIGMTR